MEAIYSWVCLQSLLVILWFSEALTVHGLPCDLHQGLGLWIHIQDALLTSALLTL